MLQGTLQQTYQVYLGERDNEACDQLLTLFIMVDTVNLVSKHNDCQNDSVQSRNSYETWCWPCFVPRPIPALCCLLWFCTRSILMKSEESSTQGVKCIASSPNFLHKLFIMGMLACRSWHPGIQKLNNTIILHVSIPVKEQLRCFSVLNETSSPYEGCHNLYFRVQQHGSGHSLHTETF